MLINNDLAVGASGIRKVHVLLIHLNKGHV
jgi:hypothetical protein